MLEAGEGVVDITPPLGTELAGFHKPPGKERRATDLRGRTSARALALRAGQMETAIVVLEVLGLNQEFAKRVQRTAARHTGIPAKNIRVCATHTHSAPSLMPLRQWGAVSKEYNALVEKRAVEAVQLAKKDLAQADAYLGKERVVNGNHNRTTKTWKTDAQFTKESSDNERWLDRMLHALYFLREKPKRSLLWYQFSAHPVCYTDTLAGPDWPGLVAIKTEERDDLRPVFLQGHCGDVNPGDGTSSLGDPEKVSEAVWAALHHATNHSSHIAREEIRQTTTEFKVSFDLVRLQDELQRYRQDPSACTKGEWVDASFAKDWFESASQWKSAQYTTVLSALRLGDVALAFHPAELYGVYGLTIRRDSPFENTIVVGYADDLIGYVPDPTAYEKGEYAALVVPKLIGFPPFEPDTGRRLAAGILDLLKKFD